MSTNFTKDQLKAFIERIEKLEVDKKAISDDISEVYKEAKNEGFDVSVIRAIIADRKVPEQQKQEFDSIYELYVEALN